MSADEQWWEPRRDGEPTAQYLARVLEELGATDVAANARALHYDDFLCPVEVDDGFNIHRLIRDVTQWANTHNQPRRARIVTAAAVVGEFDSTAAESAAWAQSPEGQELFAELRAGRLDEQTMIRNAAARIIELEAQAHIAAAHRRHR